VLFVVFFTCVVPPQITSVHNEVAAVGTTAILRCASSGDTPLNFQWAFSGSMLTDDTRITGALTETLIISQLTEADNGTYTCIAINDHGRDSGEASMIVIG